MKSRGFMVGMGELAKRLEYSPPGVDMKDSVGEGSNLTFGSGVPYSKESMMEACV